MTGSRKLLIAAAAGGALASALLAATPAAAFDPVYNDGRRPYWGDYYGGPHYGYPPYPDDVYSDYDAGSTVVAMCPPGYHLGSTGRLCWPE